MTPRTTPVCANCGVAFPPAVPLPRTCTICDDERVSRPQEQTWTTIEAILQTHACELRSLETGMTEISLAPAFAIGQRAILIEQRDGCILWDCLSAVDDATIEYVRARGGLKAIAISHPHFYGAMAHWSDAFGGVPAYVHRADREWIVHAPQHVALWDGDALEIARGVTLIRAGGHFDGGTVAHVASAAAGRGALLTGDVVMVAQYGSGVSFMRSYPGYVPLRAAQIAHIASVLAPFAYETVYGCWRDRTIAAGGAEMVARAARRHLALYANAS